ncbi:glycoside hydrolase family 15 protein [Bradyrhizobium sp. Arg237L]|uniref:glycoside hydrolase family 15 protein n=1 Tax=Bradyrhizobium sp. Arg237L TaxID=3003352 RepID=UPI00249DF5AF|nr:glycoside hydrolase family 15 protein [Bradyrhizobium sp. Arg237L]MDI4232503.1 glycoside hydrolase family 15 protein [Bradyrhizobium sp. Arg237L]
MDPNRVPEPLLSANPAPAGPGVQPFWARADKDGVGTAMSWSSQLWFTMAKGVITEIYFPDIDTPQVRDIQFLVTDGSTFFHDPKVDYHHECKPIHPEALGYRLTNTAIGQAYKIIHEVISEQGASTLLIRTKLEGDANLLKKLRVYALLAPHIEGAGSGNSGFVARTGAGNVLAAYRNNTWLAMGANLGFSSTSCGYVGVNDGWQDVIGRRRLPEWNYDCVFNGNIALMGEIDLNGATEFVLALAFSPGDADTPNASLTALFEALSSPFEAPAGSYSHLSAFLAGWQEAKSGWDFQPAAHATFDAARLFKMSCNVLLAHEDKRFNGALVASLSIPWGEANGDSDGGYHLVWPRDMSQSASALLAAGETDLPLRGLLFLAATQKPDGSWSQNFYISGKGHWLGTQLDEYSFPILLAHRVRVEKALQFFDPRSMVMAAARALIAGGPSSPMERWEENAGYSPSTLAANIAALVCAADFVSQEPEDQPTAEFLLDYADFLESHLEQWLVTTKGDLLPGIPRHYIRLLPIGDPALPEPDPDDAIMYLKNVSGPNAFPARNIVDAGFLELVRYGIRAPRDQLIEDSLKVVDASIKDDLPGGPCWRRYTHDGYGQTDSGGPFRDVGVGRPWPLLTGERGHYEFAAGRDPSIYIEAMEAFAGDRGLLAEQLWNAKDLNTPTINLQRGGATGSSMPLAWAHAEYIKLVRSVSDGKPFDRIQIVADRYLKKHKPSPLEIWNRNRQIPAIPRGRTLRIQSVEKFDLHWSRDGWTTVQDTNATATAVGIFYADIATDQHARGPIVFTFYWLDSTHWEGRDYEVNLL